MQHSLLNQLYRAVCFISDNAIIGAQVQLRLSVYNGGKFFRYELAQFRALLLPRGRRRRSDVVVRLCWALRAV